MSHVLRFVFIKSDKHVTNLSNVYIQYLCTIFVYYTIFNLFKSVANHQINCPKPIRNVYGHYYSREKLQSGKLHVVRLLEFQPGDTLVSVPRSDFLFYQVGEYVANLDRLLKVSIIKNVIFLKIAKF